MHQMSFGSRALPGCAGGAKRSIEVCMGMGIDMGIPMGMGFLWECPGNGNSFWVTNMNVNGNGNNVMGMGMTHM